MASHWVVMKRFVLLVICIAVGHLCQGAFFLRLGMNQMDIRRGTAFQTASTMTALQAVTQAVMEGRSNHGILWLH